MPSNPTPEPLPFALPLRVSSWSPKPGDEDHDPDAWIEDANGNYVHDLFALVALANRAAQAEAENARLLHAGATLSHEVEQTLGRALRYPKLPADWDTDDVCVGDHVPETLAKEAAEKILNLEAENARLRRVARAGEIIEAILDGILGPRDQPSKELVELRAALEALKP